MRNSIVFTVVATILFLSLAEGIVRLCWPRPMFVERLETTERSTGADRERPLEALTLFGRDGNTLFHLTANGWRLSPATHLKIQAHTTSGLNVDIRTNSLGLRGSEIGPKEGVRVIFLGDSITLADYLPENQTIPALVTDRLKSRGVEIQAINAGVAALGTAAELSLLREILPHTDPDLVVLNFYLNDATVCCALQVAPLPRWLRWSRFAYYFHRALVSHTFFGLGGAGALPSATLRHWRESFFAAQGVTAESLADPAHSFLALVNDEFINWGNVWSPDAWATLRPLFIELKELSDSHDFAVLIVGFPVRFQMEYQDASRYPQHMLKGMTHEFELPYLDLLPKLEAAQAKPADLYYDPAHPTLKGNEVIADSIAEALIPLVREGLYEKGRDG